MSATAVRERPILFAGRLVRAILEGQKTQTRRVVRPQPEQRGEIQREPAWYWPSSKLDAGYCHTDRTALERLMADCSPYGSPGDRLWVRETWAPRVVGKVAVPDYERSLPPLFRADDERLPLGFGPWRPSIFMPRWASRIDLEVVAVRVERLQEISECDAVAEGLTAWSDPPRVPQIHYGESRADVWETDPRKAFARLWDSINGKRAGASWEANPFVWVISFRRIRP